ncbi:MAG: hypothetical protein A2736_01015 [Candidatus Yanofskybacteria bacterium RIFCSPHIGHO2_01_FULL_41_27]|uniref:Uncharacterized protein n=1 Tax=Candidatus Yanofskybacteria bacterium RIFCSPHIGHO2_01_FULL_41_27 TaxID=1802662 RepID=A0A1F8EHS2_9BACT|nr:MAG: hypothetical protein A2736_01015 [Candidatus Yanofskybacteria bacterium RIFCSPHIGHO2_01_FULL_41_27]
MAAGGGFGHGYFSVEKFRDPASVPSRFRHSNHPPVRAMIIRADSRWLSLRIICGAFWLKSELFLTKIRTANFDAPLRRRSLTLATQQKSFLHIF